MTPPNNTIHVPATFDLVLDAQDLHCIVWARNLTSLALSRGDKQDRAKPTTVDHMLFMVERGAQVINQGGSPDGELMEGFVLSGWGLLDMAEHWQTLPRLMRVAQKRGLTTPDPAFQISLRGRLAVVLDELRNGNISRADA